MRFTTDGLLALFSGALNAGIFEDRDAHTYCFQPCAPTCLRDHVGFEYHQTRVAHNALADAYKLVLITKVMKCSLVMSVGIRRDIGREIDPMVSVVRAVPGKVMQ